MKKKLLALLLVVTMTLSLFTVFAGCTPREKVLKVLNVADYIEHSDKQNEPSVLRDFAAWYEKTFGETIKVEYQLVDTPEMMYQRIKNGKKDFDLICPSDYMIDKMRREDLLQKFDFSTLPEGVENNTKNVSPFITETMTQNLSDDINDYFVGYMWGTMGILYNPERLRSHGVTDVNNFVSSWSALWGKDETQSYPQLNGQIWMKDSIRDTFFCGSVYANRTAAEPWKATNDTSAANVAKTLAALKEQKKIFKGYEVDEGKTDMVAGRADMSFQWAGDALYAMQLAAEKGITLDYSIPEEGSNMFFDGWAIPVYAQNTRLAHLFVNYLCSSEIAIRNMDYIGYTSCVATEELLNYFTDDEEDATDVAYFFPNVAGANSVKINPIYYPQKSVLDKCEVMLYFSTKKDADGTSPEERVKDMWDELKAYNV